MNTLPLLIELICSVKLIDNKITILCDCKNAVNYVLNNYNPPMKYGKILQSINELIYSIKNKQIEVKFHWIPGHTDNKWNDIAENKGR